MRGGEVLYESLLGLSEKGSPLHTTALLAEVERAVEAAGGWAEFELVAVGVGPGSFTGLRVGVATARALGLSCGLRVAGVGTLDALGRGLGERSGGSMRLPVLDARRGEVFAASFAADGKRVWEPFVCPPEELAERIATLGRAGVVRRIGRGTIPPGAGGTGCRDSRGRRPRPPDRRTAHLRPRGARGWS